MILRNSGAGVILPGWGTLFSANGSRAGPGRHATALAVGEPGSGEVLGVELNDPDQVVCHYIFNPELTGSTELARAAADVTVTGRSCAGT